MSRITDKSMQAGATDLDQWLTESFGKGHGALLGRITPSGVRNFYFRYSGSKGQVRLPIGPYSGKGDGERAFTTGQARDRARLLSTLYRDGITDLREHFARQEADRVQAEERERQRVIDEQLQRERDALAAEAAQSRRLTFRQLFDRWRATDLQPVQATDGSRRGRKDGGKLVFEQFTRHVFPSIGNMPLEDVRKSDLIALIDAQAGKQRTQAMLLSDLKQMMVFALDRDHIAADPLATVKKSRIVGKSVERDRALSDDEIGLLVPSIEAARMTERSATAIWLTLATGVRVGELLGAVWAVDLPADARSRSKRLEALQALADAEGVKLGLIDVVGRTWYLADTKNQRDHTIHLSDFALVQIGKLAQLREVLINSPTGALSPWLFPATDNARPVCVKSLGKQLADRQREPEQRLSNRSKATTALMLPGGRWTAHDLRRTSATVMARLGFGSDTINECLNHVQTDKMARVYIQDRREADQKRAFDALGARLDVLTTGVAAGSNVVTIRAA